jgi:cytochrome d ubiquinol oxidase subunit II
MRQNTVPPTMSIRDAASPPSSQGFVLVGAIIMIPVVLFHTAYAYCVFRGKVRAGGVPLTGSCTIRPSPRTHCG